MGRWTLDHHDDVLRNKLKTMVAGAVKRAKLEKGEPTITYEAFVEELDEGDAFTSALIDVLVKEMAERRTRPNPIDRRLYISHRTAKSLSLQASGRVYENRRRRRFNFLDYPPAPPMVEPEPSDDEDFGQPSDTAAPEGVRLNTDLYDAYSPMDIPNDDELRQSEHDGLMSRLISELPPYSTDTIERDAVALPRAQSPQALPGFRPNLWHHTTHINHSHLHRSSSLRRPTRARTDNFSDFTFRRRYANRQSSLQEGENSRPDDPADGTWDFSGPRYRPSEEPPSASNSAPTTLPHARRFFPLSAWTSSARRRYPPVDIWGPEPRAPSPLASSSSSASTPVATAQDATAGPSSGSQSSSQLWYTLTTGHRSPGAEPRRHSIGEELPSERRLAPRLRRGGLRAPESLLSRYASPSMESINTTTPAAADASASGTLAEADDTQAPEAEAGPDAESRRSMERGVMETSLSMTTGGGTGTPWDANEEAQQLLTPRSVSPSVEQT